MIPASFALVGAGELDQVGDVGGVERLNELARGFVVAGLDRVEHLLDESGTKVGFFVHDGLRRVRFLRKRGGDVLALAHDAPFDWTRWRRPMGAAALAQPPSGA